VHDCSVPMKGGPWVTFPRRPTPEWGRSLIAASTTCFILDGMDLWKPTWPEIPLFSNERYQGFGPRQPEHINEWCISRRLI
jgi:hypothetical protein